MLVASDETSDKIINIGIHMSELDFEHRKESFDFLFECKV